MTHLWINDINIEYFLYTFHITQFKNTKYSLLHVVWYEAFQLLKFSMSQGSKKGPFAALTIKNFKNFYFNVFPESCVVLFTCYQIEFIRQSLRENFFPMRNTLDHSYGDRLLNSCGENFDPHTHNEVANVIILPVSYY